MTRINYEVVKNGADKTNIPFSCETYNFNDTIEGGGVLTIDSTVVTDGILVEDAFGAKSGSLICGFIFSDTIQGGSVTLRKGGYDSGTVGYATSSQDIVYDIPADNVNGQPYLIRVQKAEPYVKNQDSSLLVDISAGKTGKFFAFNEASHLVSGS